MLSFHPPSFALPETDRDDPRVGHLLGTALDDPAEARAVLIGFPSDEGVRINGGRPGAAQGPEAIRRQLYKMTPDARSYDAFVELLAHTADLGDLAPAGRLEQSQAWLGEALAPYLRRGAVPLLLGGGHETAFGHFLGYVQAEKDVAILNWDAHADVRPLKNDRAHSGSPFRQALIHSSGRCRGYTVAGLLPHSAARTHVAFVGEKGGRVFWRDKVNAPLIDRLYEEAAAPLLVTFDLDAVEAAHAPGVSAPAAGGLPVDLWLHAAYRAGRCPAVTSFDVVELNPSCDVDHRTARLAALTVWHFLRGLAIREGGDEGPGRQ